MKQLVRNAAIIGSLSASSFSGLLRGQENTAPEKPTASSTIQSDFLQSILAKDDAPSKEMKLMAQIYLDINQYADNRASLVMSLQVLDSEFVRSEPTTVRKWNELKPKIKQLISGTEDSIIAGLNDLIEGKDPEAKKFLKTISQQKILLNQQLGIIETLLLSQTENLKQPVLNNVQENPSNENAPRPSSRSNLQLTLASPFEESLQATGLYDDLAGVIGKVFKNNVMPLLDSDNPGESLLSGLKSSGWRSRLGQKIYTRPQDVIPLIYFDTLLNQKESDLKLRSLVEKVNSKAQSDSEQWKSLQAMIKTNLASGNSLMFDAFLDAFSSDASNNMKQRYDEVNASFSAHKSLRDSLQLLIETQILAQDLAK